MKNKVNKASLKKINNNKAVLFQPIIRYMRFKHKTNTIN